MYNWTRILIPIFLLYKINPDESISKFVLTMAKIVLKVESFLKSIYKLSKLLWIKKL